MQMNKWISREIENLTKCWWICLILPSGAAHIDPRKPWDWPNAGAATCSDTGSKQYKYRQIFTQNDNNNQTARINDTEVARLFK